MSLEYWYVFPVAIVFATIAMASGVGGATFFAPFFILVLRLPPEVAIGTGLITEVFGFASGLFAYVRVEVKFLSDGYRSWYSTAAWFACVLDKLADTALDSVARAFGCSKRCADSSSDWAADCTTD